MIFIKFELYENWLFLGYVINDEKRKGSVLKVLFIRNNLGQFEKVRDGSIIDFFCFENVILNWVLKILELIEDFENENDNRGIFF